MKKALVMLMAVVFVGFTGMDCEAAAKNYE